MSKLEDRYVHPGRRYLELIIGHFLRLPEQERAEFAATLEADARIVTDDELDMLFRYGWRAALTAAWMVGVARRDEWRDHLAEFLLASETCYAGRGYCFALARFGTAEDAEILAAYLDRRRPRRSAGSTRTAPPGHDPVPPAHPAPEPATPIPQA